MTLQRVLLTLAPAFLAAASLAAPSARPEASAAVQAQANPPASAPASIASPGQKPESILNIRGEVRFYALHWQEKGDWLYADGLAEVHYKNRALWADHLEINTKTKDVLAVGSVVLHVYKQTDAGFAAAAAATKAAPPAVAPPTPAAKPVTPATVSSPSDAPQPDQVIHADRLEINLDTVEGRMSKVSALIQPTLSLQAEDFERKSGIDHMKKMSFTTCTQPTPRWKFSCAKADLKQEDYIAMWGAVFSIKKIPVFYWPYMRYPLEDSRTTGFLMPEIGYSGTKGVFYSQAFYWAIARNQDLTLQLDAYSKRGLGAGSEWRYLFGGGTAGKLSLFYFKFKSADAASTSSSTGDTNAYIIRWNHNQTLPGGFTLAAAVDYQSSFDFLREFDNNFQSATVSNRRSQVYLSKSWSKFSLSMRASQFETYFPEYNGGQSIITRYLPQISLSSYKLKLIGPLYLSFGGGFSRWQYGWQADYDAGNELRLQTASFSPVISLPWSALPWLSANFSLAGNANYYWQTYQTDAESGTRSVVDDPMLALTYGFAGEIIGPVFYKIYELKSGRRIKHLIEPNVAYRYDSPLADRSRIVTASGYFLYHQLSYGLTNHVYVKDPAPGGGAGAGAGGTSGAQSSGPSREVLTWGISETFYLAPETGPLSYYLVAGKSPSFSEISSYLRFFPSGNYSLDVSAAYNPYYKMLSSLRMGATIGRPTDNWYLSVSWFKSINAWLKGAADAGTTGTTGAESSYMSLTYSSLWDRHQLSVYGGFKIPRWNLEAKGEAAYNFIENKLLFTAWDVVYHYQCLDFKATVRMYYYRDTPELKFNFSVGLGNIGRTGDLLGGN
ncbi:MAG: LPS assembly protein LptD [Acidobacteriota bacterium]|nr:LPS assembly protein LptD [Acidobacteriota bacterium]